VEGGRWKVESCLREGWFLQEALGLVGLEERRTGGRLELVEAKVKLEGDVADRTATWKGEWKDVLL
jgi:hypothetical protein